MNLKQKFIVSIIIFFIFFLYFPNSDLYLNKYYKYKNFNKTLKNNL